MKKSLCLTVMILFILNIIMLSHYISELQSVKNMILVAPTASSPYSQCSSDTASQHPSIRIYIHYTALDGTKKEISTHDDTIDTGNEVINAKLTDAISSYREMYMLCSCRPLDVTVTETEAGAMIIIEWPGSLSIQFISNLGSGYRILSFSGCHNIMIFH